MVYQDKLTILMQQVLLLEVSMLEGWLGSMAVVLTKIILQEV